MAVVGGMLASALLKVITQQIGAAIGGQVKLHLNFDNDLKKMKMALESVEAVLKDAERRSIQDASVRLWLRRLTDAMYGISDMFDKFEADTKLVATIPFLVIGPNISMTMKMKKMRQELENVTDQHQNFSFKTDNSSNFQLISDERETDSYVEDETLIVGRTEEKRKIIALLSASMTQNIIVLPIYGIGGIGKTTLAKLVFNDSQFRDYSQVWIYVSQTLNLNRIGSSIISQLSNEDHNVTERQMIRNRLGQVLTNIKKLIIVLDDLWEENDSQLKELMTMLPVIKGGNVVVIVTTRDERIARKFCTVEPYKLLPLSDEMCWAIIKRKSDFQLRDDKEHLQQVGKDIAMKCGGIALAAQTLGYMLKPLTCYEWESVRNSDIWNISTPEDKCLLHHNVLACLLLSYSSMLPPLKLCFAYCAFFPKGHKILEDDLIYQWIAHDFIAPSAMFSARQLGKNYVTQLLGMSFLQYSKSSSVTVLHRDVTLFTMHDLVHDLARSIMMEDILEASETRSIGTRNCRYALLTDSSNSLKHCVACPAKIRALRFFGYPGIPLRGVAISSAKYLRVLDLSECYVPKLPNCIGKLKQLRYLNAQGVQDDEVMPMCMTKLSKLKYLNLHGSLITTLPKSIKKMKCMMHLNLSNCLRIAELPTSFVKLKELVHLDLNNCRKLDVFPELLLGLQELVYLDLSRCQCVKGAVEDLGKLTKLKYLDLSGTFLGKKSLSVLQNVISSLTQLHYLGLSSMSTTVPDLTAVEMGTFIEHITSLPYLEHLKLSNNPMIITLPESIGSLRKLCSLDISACKNLERLPECLVKMNSLRILYVEGCYNLDKSTFNQSSFIGRSNLVVQCGRDSRSDLTFQHARPDKKLKISSIELMKFREVVKSIVQMRKQRIEKLELEWNRDDDRSLEDMEVLGKLLPPITLKYFELRGYSSVIFPAWVMSIAQYLPNIVEIWMCGLPKCNSLPPLGQLPNLKELHIWGMDSIRGIDEEFYGGVKAFPLLWEFELRCMESLEEWNTMYSNEENGETELIGPNLHRLSLYDCPYLRLKPCPPKAKLWEIVRSDNVLTSWGEGKQTYASSSTAVTDVTVMSSKVPLHQWRLLHHLPALNSLRIEGCNDVTCSSQQIMRDLCSIRSLHLEDNGQEEIPQWLGEITSLRELDIRGCLKLYAPLESMKQLTSLRALSLFRCGGTVPPQWLSELSSLEELLISECPELNNLQGSVQQLTSLKLLSVHKCGILSLPECLGNLQSLRRLEIIDCRGIKSLPESIKKLTNLEDLSIIDCPDLKRWYELKGKKKKPFISRLTVGLRDTDLKRICERKME